MIAQISFPSQNLIKNKTLPQITKMFIGTTKNEILRRKEFYIHFINKYKLEFKN